ncbi:MAG: SDR family NAD(P)-dependent oxidoreductase [Desulfuromonadaceae bacterium]|nr:SDR family NAD(P)-dependent oxidoreductase [Desulfuromonadaceae bacterium]
MSNLHGKVALITGSASGMGKKTALRLAEQGVKIVINDIVPEKVELTVAEFKAKGFDVLGKVADICNYDSVNEMVRSAVETFGSLDILVNNAGMERAGAIRNLSEKDWDITLNVNLKGAFLCSQAVHGYMVEKGCGRIINIASRAWLGGAGQAPYASAKAGLVGLTRTLALELGRKGVTVNCIAPGLIHTPMWEELPEKNRLAFLAKQPTGKIGEDDDIANAIKFFVDDDASFITGQVFYVCGGRSLYAA